MRGLLVLLLLAGCVETPTGSSRAQVAHRIAAEAEFTAATLAAGRFSIQAYFKVRNSAEPISVYIEGDGRVWTRVAPSSDPTPLNPIALRLAAEDPAENILYLARPCHYQRANCDVRDWTSGRMSEEVVEAYQELLQQFQLSYGVKRIRLVGYSGGGAIAALLASRLSDKGGIVDLRTVAGNLDHQLWTRQLNLLPLADSLNPKNYARELENLPQLHFVGADDQVINESIVDSFIAQMRTDDCAEKRLEPASHVRGWKVLWPKLSQLQPVCNSRPVKTTQ